MVLRCEDCLKPQRTRKLENRSWDCLYAPTTEVKEAQEKWSWRIVVRVAARLAWRNDVCVECSRRSLEILLSAKRIINL